MHYLGFVFVNEPTEAAVETAMAYHKNIEWDWYRCGGRWDGYLLGEDEMKARQTHNGFNFDDANKSAGRNSCLVKDIPEGKEPHFFVSDYDFVPKQYYNKYFENDRGSFGAFLDTPKWRERYNAALAKNTDKYIVVVDIHD